MKKLFILLLATLSAVSSATVYATEANNPVSAPVNAIPDQCVIVGNVSASVTVRNTDTLVNFCNYNNYRVTVIYTVTALNNIGNRVEVGAGTVSLDKEGDNRKASHFIQHGYAGYSVRIEVLKCE